MAKGLKNDEDEIKRDKPAGFDGTVMELQKVPGVQSIFKRVSHQYP